MRVLEELITWILNNYPPLFILRVCNEEKGSRGNLRKIDVVRLANKYDYRLLDKLICIYILYIMYD